MVLKVFFHTLKISLYIKPSVITAVSSDTNEAPEGKLQGSVHPRMTQSLSTQPHAEGEPGQVSLSTKRFWSFTAKTGLRHSHKLLK